MKKLQEREARTELELKYCERCGGLWVRRKGSAKVYCRPCHLIMAELPIPRARRVKPVVAPGELGMSIEVKELMGFCEDGGVA